MASPTPDVTVRPMTSSDLPWAGDLHRQVFPLGLVSELGDRHLQAYYKFFLDIPDCTSLVIYCGNEPAGLCVATRSPVDFYWRFYRRRLMFALTGVWKSLDSRAIRQSMFRRLRRACMGLVRLPLRSKDSTLDQPGNAARLLLLAVDERWRGCDFARQLVGHLTKVLAPCGIDALFLTVAANNGRAIAFYRKTGWVQETSVATAGALVFRLAVQEKA